MHSKVYLTKADGDDVHGALKRLVDKLKLPKALHQKIGIKINLCDYRLPCAGCTTDPRVLDALLSVLKNIYPSGKIFLFENDATGTLADNLFLWLGLDKVAAKYDVKFVNLIREEWV